METIQELQNKIDDIFEKNRYIVKNVYIDNGYKKCSIYCSICKNTDERRINHVLAGHGCKFCSYEIIRNKKLIHLKEKQKRLDKNIKNNPLILIEKIGKEYLVYCKDCYEEWCKPWNIISRYKRCPNCNKKENSIRNKRPELIQYFIDEKDADKSIHSNKNTKLKCPFCGLKKDMIIANFCKRGFKCDICDSGRSFPERFMSSILFGNNIEYISQYSPSWANGKKYDFYIPAYNCIIEMHGEQHYIDSTLFKNLKYQKETDEEKMAMALDQGFNYYVIDSCYSNMDYIENSINQSGLIDYLNIIITNEQRERVYMDDIKKQCWDLYDSGENINDIAKIIHRDKRTVREYLKTGYKLGLCTYQKYNKQIAKVNIETEEIEDIFIMIKTASEELGVPKTTISRWCNQGGKIIYQDKYRIIWLEDYEKYFNEKDNWTKLTKGE